MPKQRTAARPLDEALEWAGSAPMLAHEARVTETTVKTWVVQRYVPRAAARLLSLLVRASSTPAEQLEFELALSNKRRRR